VSDEPTKNKATINLSVIKSMRKEFIFEFYYRVYSYQKKMQNLKDIGHDSGMEKFIKDLKPIINLPPAINDRPHTEYVKQANQIRGWK